MTRPTAVSPAPPRPGPPPGQPGEPAPSARRGGSRGILGRPLPAHWPLSFLVLGFPLWWVLGLASSMPVLLAVPLALQLARRRDLPLPRGFGWWLLFLAWVCLGALVLWVDAPGAVPGGDPTRLLVFGYRVAWYGTVTVWMLWLIDTGRDRLADHTVHRLVGGLLAVALAGGVLGLLAPDLEFRSGIEWLLPEALRSDAYVAALVHPQTADIQSVLGRPESRPKAPFAFTNTWGSVVSLSLLFAVAALVRSGRRARGAWLALLLLAPAPVVFSLNRGLWASLAAGALGLLVLLAARGHLRVAIGLVGAGALAVLLLAQTPLGEIPGERLDNPHSNTRRTMLTEATISSVSSGSPLVGFGTTRDVEGNFSSISGGDTPSCSSCGVPPLGTQGQAWLVLFSQGWVGLAIFAGFLVGTLRGSLRCRTLNETLCTFAVGFMCLQLLVYDTLGLPLLLVFLTIGLVARERHETASLAPEPTARRLLRDLRAVAVPGAALVLVGGLAGAGVGLLRHETTWTATTRVLLDPLPDTVPGTAQLPGPTGLPAMTVDTEAFLMRTAPDRQAGAEAIAPTTPVKVTGEKNTRIIEVTVTGPTPDQVEAAGRTTLLAWFQTRRQQLAQQRVRVIERFEGVSAALRRVDRLGETEGAERKSTGPASRFIGSAVAEIATTPLTPGEVLSSSEPERRPYQLAVPIASGAGVGLLLTALLVLRRSRTRPSIGALP